MNKIYSAFFFIGLFLTITAFAENNAAAELSSLLENVHTMQATFTQTAANQNIVGKMALERPGKFRWEASQQLIIASGNYVWIYDADLMQATKNKINYAQPGNPAMLLSGTSETLQQTFSISKSGEWFVLKPKVKNSIYQSIKLHFVDNKLVDMFIADNLGSNSKIHFENIILNADLSSDFFQFSPPKGTDVIVQ